mmetsp:Transcript_63281/g.133476  ORF Transcript_63281/g.133476 Transcript_63281/m.133476 type:complete len:115 (-) Transcript_63281:155-499(-)
MTCLDMIMFGASHRTDRRQKVDGRGSQGEHKLRPPAMHLPSSSTSSSQSATVSPAKASLRARTLQPDTLHNVRAYVLLLPPAPSVCQGLELHAIARVLPQLLTLRATRLWLYTS